MLYDGRNSVIKEVGSFPALEINIRILGSSTGVGIVRVHCPVLEPTVGFPVHQGGHIVIIDNLYFLDFVGGSEPVVEMHEGNPPLKGCKMGNQSKIHGFLDRRGCQHGKSCLPGSHYILVVSEDG